MFRFELFARLQNKPSVDGSRIPKNEVARFALNKDPLTDKGIIREQL